MSWDKSLLLGPVFALDTLRNRVNTTLKNNQNRNNTQQGDYLFLYFLNKEQERFLENQTACVYPASLSEIIMSQRLNGICASPPQRDYGVKHLRKKQGLGRLV